MQKMIMTAAVAVMLVTGAQAKASGQTGKIIVYRWASAQGIFARFEFNVNHGPAHFLRSGQKETIELPAGDYTISHDSTFAAGQDAQVAHVEAGKTGSF
jgi:hypothetical protein